MRNGTWSFAQDFVKSICVRDYEGKSVNKVFYDNLFYHRRPFITLFAVKVSLSRLKQELIKLSV